MKNREIACIFYVCEGECKKGRAGTFRKACQKCQLYKPLKGSRPARKDLRKKKREDIYRKETKEAIRDY